MLGTVTLPSLSKVGVLVPGCLGVAPVTTEILTVLVVAVAVPILSLSSTDLVLVPVVIVKVSGSAVIAGLPTTTVAVVVAQFPLFNLSHIWYTIV